MGIRIVVFYDDGMAVGNVGQDLRRAALQIQCDLLHAGLVPGVGKCTWVPTQVIAWNGLIFDFVHKGIRVMDHRMDHTSAKIGELLGVWPKVTFRQVSQFLGQLNSMHPVLRGQATLRSKMLQTIVNIRHFHGYSWDAQIVVEGPGLLENAKLELEFWQKNLVRLNFRLFNEKAPEWYAWVDASDVAVGGVLVQLVPGGAPNVPATMDNWLLQMDGFLLQIRNCASLQIGVGEEISVIVTNHDLDPDVVQNMYTVHRNLNYIEQATDSNERELLAAVEVLIGCLRYLRGAKLTEHFDNMNAATICEKVLESLDCNDMRCILRICATNIILSFARCGFRDA